MRIRFFMAALALVLFGSGCSAINDFGRFMFGDTDAGVDGGSTDAGVDGAMGPDGGLDAGIDAGPDAGFDAGVDAGPRPPTAIVQTAGGDTVIENSEYRLRISVGAPIPLGDSENAGHRLRVGPQTR